MQKIIHKLKKIINDIILKICVFIRIIFKIETLEDRYQIDKINNNKYMNKVQFDFQNKDDFELIEKNLLLQINDNSFLSKFNITTESILNEKNNIFTVNIDKKCNIIYLHFNHYYMSGANMISLMNRTFNNKKPKYLCTDPLLGILYLPM